MKNWLLFRCPIKHFELDFGPRFDPPFRLENLDRLPYALQDSFVIVFTIGERYDQLLLEAPIIDELFSTEMEVPLYRMSEYPCETVCIEIIEMIVVQHDPAFEPKVRGNRE